MDGPDRGTRWTSIKQRLRLKAIGCCGATWIPTSSTLTIMETEPDRTEPESATGLTPRHVSPSTGMNLAMALAAERNSRDVIEVGPTDRVVKIKSLIQETDGCDWAIGMRKRREEDWVCCVCMERGKDAAFIPCGHAFCRVCSREMWINRGMCPICNRPILEILDIY